MGHSFIYRFQRERQEQVILLVVLADIEWNFNVQRL